jgi:hypothetical protein
VEFTLGAFGSITTNEEAATLNFMALTASGVAIPQSTLPAGESHTQTVLSLLPLASNLPSGENDGAVTGALWPDPFQRILPVFASAMTTSAPSATARFGHRATRQQSRPDVPALGQTELTAPRRMISA